MMRPKLKSVFSPDVVNLPEYRPAEPDNVGILWHLFIGPDDDTDNAESFDVMVCTLDWLKQTLSEGDVISGRHYLITPAYNYDRIMNYIHKFLHHCHGNTWEEVAQKVGRLGRWEFEDTL